MTTTEISSAAASGAPVKPELILAPVAQPGGGETVEYGFALDPVRS
jgi:hypothetical protein